MTIAKQVSVTVDQIPLGTIFTRADFAAAKKNPEAVTKTLNRMVTTGAIKKISKGKFFKPEGSIFGELQPGRDQLIKDLLEKNGKITGYLTGTGVFNQMGLTTQISHTIEIGKNSIRPAFNRQGIRVQVILQRNPITATNLHLLQLLDAIRYIKSIPDTRPGDTVVRIMAILEKLSVREFREFVRLASNYSPATRALAGAMLDTIGFSNMAITLRNSLNPLSKFKFPGTSYVLRNGAEWNLIE